MTEQPHILTQDGTCPHGCNYDDDGDSYVPHRYPEPITSSTQVGPHNFSRLGLVRRNICRSCYLPRDDHPTGWTPARPLGDTTPPDRHVPNTSPALVELLRRLGQEYGPLGVALAAADLTDREVLIRQLTADPADVPITRTIPRP